MTSIVLIACLIAIVISGVTCGESQADKKMSGYEKAINYEMIYKKEDENRAKLYEASNVISDSGFVKKNVKPFWGAPSHNIQNPVEDRRMEKGNTWEHWSFFFRHPVASMIAESTRWNTYLLQQMQMNTNYPGQFG